METMRNFAAYIRSCDTVKIAYMAGCVGFAGYELYNFYREYQVHQEIQRQFRGGRKPKPRKDSSEWNTAFMFDHQNNKERKPMEKMVELIKKAEHSVDIAMYTSGRCPMEDAIFALVESKQVKVRAIVNDKVTADRWRSHNVDVIQWQSGKNDKLMHHKFLIIDNEAIMTGSLNWTMHGINGNFENVVVTTDEHTVKRYVKHFEELLARTLKMIQDSAIPPPRRNSSTNTEPEDFRNAANRQATVSRSSGSGANLRIRNDVDPPLGGLY